MLHLLEIIIILIILQDPKITTTIFQHPKLTTIILQDPKITIQKLTKIMHKW